MKTEEAFNVFLDAFVEKVKEKSTALKIASWELETTGSKQAAADVVRLSKEFKLLFNNEETYQKLQEWKKEGTITSPDLLRVLNLLIKKHKVNLVPAELLQSISSLETQVSQAYINFRAHFEGKEVTENDLLDILKTETDVDRRKIAWDETKKVGEVMAPLLLDLVKKRNEQAHRLGYSDYYKMKLDIDEVDNNWLFQFLDEFDQATKEEYLSLVKEINSDLAHKYDTTTTAIGPWAWKDPFCQEDPLASEDIDSILENEDIVKLGKQFYDSMGFDVDDILSRSDLFERKGKNQHAFCVNLDQEDDIRTLCNIRPNIRWLETIIHELGHAEYEKGYDKELHWYLRTPPHMITTEAVALITGRHAHDAIFLKDLLKDDHIDEKISEATQSLKRRQLIFSRWVLVMMHFEAALYANPEQDLNNLWWTTVQKYQKICPSSYRGGKQDWACKCHFGIAPVYYHSYLLGEFFASMLKAHFQEINGSSSMYKQPSCSKFLKEKLFFPGNRTRWDRLIQMIMGEPLQFKSWIKDFCSK
ncbi:MAG: hypothetical protein S4CHLAM6_03960 [Chlamydiae bacterium]|nr:hypothetical protein [Chlamydiota bacterium]